MRKHLSITEGPELYDFIIKAYPLYHTYNSATNYGKYLCPICLDCGQHTVLETDMDNCPCCNINLDWRF